MCHFKDAQATDPLHKILEEGGYFPWREGRALSRSNAPSSCLEEFTLCPKWFECPFCMMGSKTLMCRGMRINRWLLVLAQWEHSLYSSPSLTFIRRSRTHRCGWYEGLIMERLLYTLTRLRPRALKGQRLPGPKSTIYVLREYLKKGML